MDAAWTIILEFWNVLGEMAPYLLFGFLFAGVLSVLISPLAVERHLGGRGPWPVIKAALFGIPLPLCSCGVIPVSASLRRHGAGRGATTSFLLSTPQTGVDSILVTYSLLGPVFAVFRPFAALASGLIGGAIVALSSPDRSADDAGGRTCEAECCAGQPGRGVVSRIITYGFVTLPRDIGKALLIGLAVAGVISALVPDDYFAGLLGAGLGSMLVMMLLGLPVYVCATASVPVAAALVSKGVSPGAALVFLMTGPATNAAAITTVWQMMGRRTALVYLGTVAATALGSGLILDYVFTVGQVPVGVHPHGLLPGWVNTVAAVVLLVVMGAAVFAPGKSGSIAESSAETGERTATLTITGMTCSHCADHVRRALLSSAGVVRAEVGVRRGRAVVGGGDLDVGALCGAVEGLGYGVTITVGPTGTDSSQGGAS